MDDRLLYLFITNYDSPSEIIEELNLGHEEVLEMLLTYHKEEVLNLLFKKFTKDDLNDMDLNDIEDLEDLKWIQ